VTTHNALEQAPEILKAYLLAAGLNENEEGVIRLGETLTPTLDIWSQPEWALLRGETPWGFNRVVTAGGAGTMAGVAVCNPASSGIVVVVQKVTTSNMAAGQIHVMMIGTDAALLLQFGNTEQVKTRDRRRSTRGQALVRYGNTIVGLFAGDEMEYQQRPANESATFVHLPVMLYANQGLLVQTNDDAAAITVAMSGYERKCILNEARG
jgi:hypothetical protein